MTRLETQPREEGDLSVFFFLRMMQRSLKPRYFSLFFFFPSFLRGLETQAYFPSVKKAFNNSTAITMSFI